VTKPVWTTPKPTVTYVWAVGVGYVPADEADAYEALGFTVYDYRTSGKRAKYDNLDFRASFAALEAA
jgi:hypothetical protein